MNYIKAVGIRLNELLKEANFNQTSFSKKCNISRITINRTIKGKVSVITFETLIVFCKTLKITLKDFFASELFNENIEFGEKKRLKQTKIKQ